MCASDVVWFWITYINMAFKPFHDDSEDDVRNDEDEQSE